MKRNKPLIYVDFFRSLRSRADGPLPLREGRAGRGGRRASALFLLLLGLGPAPLLQAAGDERQQIEQAIDGFLAERVAEEAERQGWQDLRFSREAIDLLGGVPPPCAEPPTVERSDKASELQGRQRFTLRCAGQPEWNATALTEVHLFLPVLYAGQTIERGQPLAAAPFKRQETHLGKLGRGFYQQADEVQGMAAKRRIRAGQLLTPALVAAPLLVKRGQQVTIVASQDGIQAATLGEALENGLAGEVIRVRNLRSEKVIKAKVMEAGVVSSLFE